MESRQNNQKMAALGQNNPLWENFQNSSIKVQRRTSIDFFARISCRSVPLQRKASSLYPLQNTHLSAATLHPFGPAHGSKILTREISVRPTYACNILSGSVKVCRQKERSVGEGIGVV